MRIISWFAMVCFLLEITYSVNFSGCLGTVELLCNAAVRIIPGHEKWPTQGRPFSSQAQRYTLAYQEQFSRPMTGHTPRKLPAQPQSPASSQCVVVFPTHRKHILPLLLSFVKHFSRNFFKIPKKFFDGFGGSLKSVSQIHENRFIPCFSGFPTVIICFLISHFKMVFCPNLPVFTHHFVDMHHFPRPSLFLSKPVSFHKKNVYTSIARPIIPSF